MSFLNKETPGDLQELFKDALINNTFSQQHIHESLRMEIENSYSYLYRLQRNMIRYENFHYQTRRFLLTTSRNEILDRVAEINERLEEIALEESTEELEAEKKSLLEERSDLVRVEPGDFYLDSRYRPCITIPFDFIYGSRREGYRVPYKTELYGAELTFEDVVNYKNPFAYLPLVMVDNKFYFDVKFVVENGSTTLIFSSFNESNIYDKDGYQILHDVCIMFIDNIFVNYCNMQSVSLPYYSEDCNWIPKFNGYLDKQIPPTADGDGMFVAFVKTDSMNYYYPIFDGIELVFENNYWRIPFPQWMLDMIMASTSFDIYLIYWNHLKRYEPYMGGDLEDWDHVVVLEREENTPYAMPIPEVNILLTRIIDECPYPIYNIEKTLHYPNIYTFRDNKRAPTEGPFRIYYMYKEADSLKYTPMHDFYYRYLKYLGGDQPMEQIINLLVHGTPEELTNYEWVQDEERFKEVFQLIYKYKIDQQQYSIHDFLRRETWTKRPPNYQTQKLKELIKNDYNVLRNYARHQRTHGEVFHMFGSNINLKKRFRSSTAFEDRKNPYSFFSGFTIITEEEALDEENPPESPAYQVISDDEETDPFYTIRVQDFASFENPPQVGDYVLLEDYDPAYVFVLKPNKDLKKRKLRIFIDGLYCGDYRDEIFEDFEYIYLPASTAKSVAKVTEDSYIMLEEMHELKYVTTKTFTEAEPTVEIELISHPKTIPTAEDLYLLDKDGYEIPYADYEITPIIKDSEFEMHDEEGNKVRTHASVLKAKITMLNTEFMNQDVEIRVCKIYERFHEVLERRSFPRLVLHDVVCNRQLKHVQIWKNGRLVPENLYKMEQEPEYRPFGIHRIQLLTQFEIGDTIDIEYSPYTHIQRFKSDTLLHGAILNMDGYLNKPCVIDYYDFYLNGKRLGLPHVFQIGKIGLTFTNLQSSHYLVIHERERDDEYFGFEDGENTYYYDILDLIEEPFLREEDKFQIIKDIIDNQKDENVVIGENTDDEEHIVIDNYSDLEEAARIWYYEELLPLGLANPDLVQSDKAYFKYEFPELAEMYLTDYDQIPDLNNGEVIMMQPDFNIDAEMEDTIVMLLGENEIND